MKIVLAELKDLAQIKEIYTKIVKNMYNNGIEIWNEYYPNEVFETDIENKSLYLLKENNNILGAFVMYEHNNLEDDIKWEDKTAKAYLLNRVGVNVEYLRQGVGKKLISFAGNLAKEKGAKYLRLLVSEFNIPAINLYSKSEDYSLNEYGFEMRLE